MRLRNISISENNYETLRNLGRAGDSFNDVVSELIKLTMGSSLKDNGKKPWSEHRPLNQAQTVTSPHVNSDV